MSNKKIILASASPRRKEILSLLGLSFDVITPTDEINPDKDLEIGKAILEVAKSKAKSVYDNLDNKNKVVVGCDTVVVLDKKILGKPKDEKDAFKMLYNLQGNTHRVYSPVWICSKKISDGFISFTDVTFYNMDKTEIKDYIQTGEPMDKAGAYGIQGQGMRYIKEIHGDFFTVMGLPGAKLWRFLNKNNLL